MLCFTITYTPIGVPMESLDKSETESKEVTAISVIVENRSGHDGSATGGHYGEWARVWASRKGIVDLKVINETHDMGGRLKFHQDFIEIEIKPNEAFGDDDYVVVEKKFSANPNLRPIGNRETFTLFLGKMPLWAGFPEAWQKWIIAMRSEAIEFLTGLADQITKAPINKEMYMCSLNSAILGKKKPKASWEEVQDMLNYQGILKYIPSHTKTWTGEIAMPVKIAKACGWAASIPQPKWAEPNKSGRVLIADDSGIVSDCTDEIITQETTTDI